MQRPPEPLVPLAQQREQAIRALSRHFAEDRLTLEEFERRVGLAVTARDLEALRSLTSDIAADPPSQELAPTGGARAHPAPRGDPDAGGQGTQLIMAIMGGNARKGSWRPARRIFVYAFWGGADLDFRDVELPPGVTEVTVIAIMGGVDVVVRPDTAIEVGGLAVMGGFDQGGDPTPAPDPERPLLKVKGFALMGGVDVSARYPGESGGDAKRRRRRESKERRRLEGS